MKGPGEHFSRAFTNSLILSVWCGNTSTHAVEVSASTGEYWNLPGAGGGGGGEPRCCKFHLPVSPGDIPRAGLKPRVRPALCAMHKLPGHFEGHFSHPEPLLPNSLCIQHFLPYFGTLGSFRNKDLFVLISQAPVRPPPGQVLEVPGENFLL